MKEEECLKYYEVTKKAEVISKKTGLTIKPHLKGFYILYLNGKRSRVAISRLLALKYIGNIEGKEVHHKNFNHDDNRIENLEILTAEEHKRIHYERNKSRGFFKTFTKQIDEKTAKEIKYSSLNCCELARKYNCSRSVVSHIKNNKSWKNV